MKLTPKNWKSFQHYKDREPAWIKLHKGLLDDYQFHCLPIASRALAPCLWLLASEYEGGVIDATFEEMAFRCHISKNELCEALNPLIDAGFFVASDLLAECKQNAIPEKRREEIEKERQSPPSAASFLKEETEEKNLFKRGREILGTGSGGLIAKLLKTQNGSVALARATVERASTKSDPREYIGRVVAGNKPVTSAGSPYPDGII